MMYPLSAIQGKGHFCPYWDKLMIFSANITVILEYFANFAQILTSHIPSYRGTWLDLL